MFGTLSDRLSGILSGLTRRGSLTEEDVNAALREVRKALLEADVALEVVRSFTDKVRERAVGAEVLKSVTPGQQVIKIVNDALIDMLGGDGEGITFDAVPPVPILMVGLQGSGKTTSTAKIAKRLTDRSKKRVLMASLDTRRPAAMEQLAILGKQVGVETLPIVAGQSAVQIARRAIEAARLGGYDVVMLDTAGRVTLDDTLMAEVAEVKAATNPHEVLLVADALTGQDAVNTARAFDARVELTGIVLTRMDGDSRGGAALSMRAVTGKPIKFAGMGEKLDALEAFDPKRVAGRILGMGDVVGLVERAAEAIQVEDAEKMAAKLAKGLFDMDDLRAQLAQMQRMGGIGALAGMIPGMKKAQAQVDQVGGEKVLVRMDAIITSMTPKERRKPELLNAKRKIRIAKGSGTTVQDVNKLIKMHQEMANAMKKIKKMGGLAGMAKMFGGGGGLGGLGGALGGGIDPAKMLSGGGGGLPGLGGGQTKLPPGFENLLKKK